MRLLAGNFAQNKMRPEPRGITETRSKEGTDNPARMIISHRHRFIFLKTNKTAGTSIEIALSRYCGGSDIITPISPRDELLRSQYGGRGPQNYRAAQRPLASLFRTRSPKPGPEDFYNHITAREVRDKLEGRVWREYFKFCFTRNPWDRVISLYYFKHRTEPRPSLTEFLESNFPLKLQQKGYELYTIDGEIAVDKVCRYENLERDLDDVCARLGLPVPLELPHAKSSFREDRRPYRELYSDRDAELVRAMFADEIALMGYEF
jgi:hypothetical protein